MWPLLYDTLKWIKYNLFNTMGGGGGGYDRPSGGNGSGGGSGDSDDKPSHVPPPNEETTEDQTDESNGTSDEETPNDSPPTSGGDGSGAPVTDPGEGPSSGHEGDDSESGEEETRQNEGNDEGETGRSEEPRDDSDDDSDEQDPTGTGSADEPEDTDSERDNQDDDQRDREEEQEEKQDHETDDGDAEDDEQEEDDEDSEEEDECLIAESALLHSPNPEPLRDAAEGDICSVHLREEAVCIVDSQDRTIGAIAEPWVVKLKECIKKGRQYRARILDIDGGKCEVRITNKCLLNWNVNLSSINTEVQGELHTELALSVKATTEGVVVVTADGSRVGDVPNPGARLLGDCIEQGRTYKAKVLDVTPKYCTVSIQNGSIDE